MLFLRVIKYVSIFFFITCFLSCSKDSNNYNFDFDDEQPEDTTEAGTLLWADEFEESGAPNEENWTHDIGHGDNGWGNNEVQYYTDEQENVRVEDGKLIIEALKEDGEWTSARIKTQGKRSFKHVTVKAKAKLPQGSGTWPAIWMLGADFVDVGWPASGEIDIMEHVGKDPGVVHSSLHTPSSHGNTQNTGSTEVPDFSDSFHVYEVEWTSERITFRIDGEAHYSYEPSTKNAETWPFNDDFFLIMNIAVGGNWGSDTQYETGGLKNGIDPDLSKVRMEVDYIRVYAN